MRRWVLPNAVGAILFVLFAGVEALCGDSVQMPAPWLIRQSIDDPPPKITTTTFGVPALVVVTDDPNGSTAVYTFRVLAVFAGAWIVAMSIGRLALDGGLGAAQRTLLPPRRHPALWLVAYLAAVPLLALMAALRDLREDGIHGLFSPTGPHRFPLLVLGLTIVGVPIVALFLAIRRVYDCRYIRRPRFETDALPKRDIPWPFD